MQSFASKCKVFLEGVAPALLDDAGKQSLLDVGQYLPAGLAWSLFGFETQLGKPTATLDMALSVSSEVPGLNILAQSIVEQSIPVAMLQTAAWQQVAKFAAQWQQDHFHLKQALDVLCLEFDMPAQYPEQAIPLVFFGVEVQGQRHRSELNIDDCAVLEHCIELFTAKPVNGMIRDCLRRCDAEAKNYGYAQPPGGVFQAGLMLARPDAGIRICVHNIPSINVSAYLQAIGWPGDLVQLDKVLTDIIEPFDRIALALDYSTGGLTPKLGIECYFRHNAQPPAEVRWQQVLQRLVADGLCTPEKAQGLLNFPAVKRLLPLANQHLDAVLGEHPGYYKPTKAMRGLHHFKIVLEADGGLSAKAYLWCGFAAS